MTLPVHHALQTARAAGAGSLELSLDLGRSRSMVVIRADGWDVEHRRYPYLAACKDRTIYYWTGEDFAPLQRYGSSLIKLVPTTWGAPTFEIDGIKMLPSAQISPYADAARKVELIAPRGKRVLDTCGGLGYFADCCVQAGAREVRSFEKDADVLWLRQHNPWSPAAGPVLHLTQGDIVQEITRLADGSFDAVLHDPPRFGIAGELYGAAFYREIARVLRPGGLLFHYTGTPNKLSSGRDLPQEVTRRLAACGFSVQRVGDGLLATKTGRGGAAGLKRPGRDSGP